MRSHIAKSLQTRSKAIKNALDAYNAAARSLNPPKPQLDWDRVTHFQFISDFPLLRCLWHNREDISQKQWAGANIRECMRQYQKLKRAKEELVRCNVEVQRLHTSIHDEATLFKNIQERLQTEQSTWATILNEYMMKRMSVNEHLLRKIAQVSLNSTLIQVDLQSS